jgi:hypothetical protein
VTNFRESFYSELFCPLLEMELPAENRPEEQGRSGCEPVVEKRRFKAEVKRQRLEYRRSLNERFRRSTTS